MCACACVYIHVHAHTRMYAHTILIGRLLKATNIKYLLSPSLPTINTVNLVIVLVIGKHKQIRFFKRLDA